jgi:hypothetical protein
MPCLQSEEEKKNQTGKKKQMPQKDNATMHAAKGNDEKGKTGGYLLLSPNAASH